MKNIAAQKGMIKRVTSIKDVSIPNEKIKIILDLLNNKKGRDIIILEMIGLTYFTDYFIICTGENAIHINAMAEDIEINLRKNDTYPISVTGQREGSWILMDYNDIIIHIFDEAARARYNLEALWLDANKIRFE